MLQENEVISCLRKGITPNAHVIFGRYGEYVLLHCVDCQKLLGRFDATYSSTTQEAIATVRQKTQGHHCTRTEVSMQQQTLWQAESAVPISPQDRIFA